MPARRAPHPEGTPRRPAAWLGLLLAALLLSGCGAVASGVVILRAKGALKEAEAAGAEGKAPYHYYRAKAYLEKAKEERGYSDYQPALRYGRIAYESSKEALKQAKGAGPEAAGGGEE